MVRNLAQRLARLERRSLSFQGNGDTGYLISQGIRVPVATGSGGATQLSDLTDVGVTTPTNKFFLIADGDSWEARAAAIADISGAAIGTDLQAWDEFLDDLAALTHTADRLPYMDSSSTAALATFTAAGRALIDDADATAQRATLGLVLGTNVQAWDEFLDDLAGLTHTTDRLPYMDSSTTAALATFTSQARNLLDDADATAMRATIGAVIGTNVQAWNAILDDLAGLTQATDRLPYMDSATTMALATFTAAGRAIIDDADATAQRATLGLTLGTQAQAWDEFLDDLAGLTHTADRLPYMDSTTTAALATFTAAGRALVDDADNTAQRATLGLVIGTDVAAFGDSRFPTSGEKSALAGTDGTPGASNKYVTDSDDRINVTQVTLPEAYLIFDPINYWSLGSSGGLTDQGSSANNLTGQGGATAGGGATMTSDNGTSADLDGSNDYFSSSAAPFTSLAKRTFVGWALRDTDASLDTLISSSSSSHAPAVRANIATNGLAVFTFTPDTSVGGGAYSINAAWPSNTKVFWAVVYDDDSNLCKMYLNGRYLGSSTIAAAYDATPGTFQIGMRSTATDPFDGKQSHVAIFDKELSTESISWLYRIGTGSVKDWGLVQGLPTTALYGDTCQYIADAASGVIWSLIYDGQGSYPWKYIGGPELTQYNDGLTSSISSTTYATYTGVISQALVLAGDYDIRLECRADGSTTDRQHWFGVGSSTTNAIDAEAVSTRWAADGSWNHMTKTIRKTGIAASATMYTQAKRVTANTRILEVGMGIKPVRVG